MRRPQLLAICALMMVLITGSRPGAGAQQLPHALWVWSHPEPGLARFARAHDFTRLLVNVPTDDAGSAAFVRLARAARRRNIELLAVSGHPSWALAPAGMASWVRQTRRADLYAGLLLDIEPYTLDEWHTDIGRTRLMRGYLRALKRAARGAGDLPVWAAVPFWFDHDAYRFDGRSLLEHVLERVEGIVVMAYRDSAAGNDGILSHTFGEIVAGAAAGKPAMIGVQTAPDELDKLTFHEEGAGAMEGELDAVRKALTGAPGFGGIAVHHLDSYRHLRP